jgi:hypothetical protein
MRIKTDEIRSIIRKEIEEYRNRLDIAETGTVISIPSPTEMTVPVPS